MDQNEAWPNQQLRNPSSPINFNFNTFEFNIFKNGIQQNKTAA